MADTRTYIRLEDHFDENKKVELVGEAAAWLFVCGLCYCSRNLTDGFIPKAKVPKLVTGRVNARVKALVEHGMWIDRGDRYEVKDYLEHQRSREQIENVRRGARERAEKWRRNNAVRAPGIRAPEAEAVSEASPGLGFGSVVDSSSPSSSDDDDDNAFSVYKSIKTALEESGVDQADRDLAMKVIWPRLKAGEKFTSPVAYALTVAANARGHRLSTTKLDATPKRMEIDGEVFTYEDGQWRRVEVAV